MDKVEKTLKEKNKYWIAFVGDSLTSCEWVHPNWREIVEYVLKEELQKKFTDWKIPSWGIRCFNCGFDGATTKDILEKTGEILKLKPNLVILMIGGNDPVLGISVEEHTKNIEEIRKQFKNTDLFLLTDINPFNEKASKKYKPYTNVQGVFNLFEEWKKYEKDKFFTFKSEENLVEGIKKGDLDFWHPNQLGNAYIAKIVLKEVFQIEFDPEKFIETTIGGYKYPEY